MEQKWSALIIKLSEKDINWIMSSGTEQFLSTKNVLIPEGTNIENLYFVIKGLFTVNTAISGKSPISVLGPGEIIGELSFIDNKRTSASVIAVEDSLVFAVPRNFLKERMNNDKGFGLRFYQALSETAADRLRSITYQLGKSWYYKNTNLCFDIERWDILEQEIANFKKLTTEADKRALNNKNKVTKEDLEVIKENYRKLTLHLNNILSGHNQVPEALKCEIGNKVQNELLPLVLLTKTAERFYSKPRGYAGDYIAIENIYRNRPSGYGRLGPVIDSCIINEPAGKAVRNRRRLFKEEIIKTINVKSNEKTYITNIASGPASEIFDVFSNLNDKSNLMVNLIDFDLQALLSVDRKLIKSKLADNVKLINENILYLILGRRKIDVDKQDLVYSMGITDYLNDKIVVKLIDFIYDTLSPNGRVILGNFHPKNSTRAFMDYVLEWKLFHRTEEDMNNLFLSSKFQKQCTNIRFEPEGINLFAECRKV